MKHFWTDADKELLRQLHADGVLLEVIAARIGSTPGSVNQMCSSLGLHHGGRSCRYCDNLLKHASVGRKKKYCDALCRATHQSERGCRARRAPYAAGLLRCEYCDTALLPFQQKYCSHRCGKAAWHRSVWDDPARRARRTAMLRRNRLARQAAA